MEQTDVAAEAGRRSFLKWVIRASGAIIGLVTIIPGVGMLFAPVIAGSNRQRRKVLFHQPIDAQSPSYIPARVEGQEDTAPGIFIRKAADGRHEALSAKCTHAGCAVSWKADKNEFFCPCHAGRFDSNGEVLSGPPPRPLDRLPVEVVGGDYFIEEPTA